MFHLIGVCFVVYIVYKVVFDKKPAVDNKPTYTIYIDKNNPKIKQATDILDLAQRKQRLGQRYTKEYDDFLATAMLLDVEPAVVVALVRYSLCDLNLQVIPAELTQFTNFHRDFGATVILLSNCQIQVIEATQPQPRKCKRQRVA